MVSTTTGVRLQKVVFLDPLEDIDTGRVGQVEVEQDQQRLALVRAAGPILAEQVVQRGCTVGERQNLIVDAGSADVPLDQAGVTLIVLDHDDGDGISHVSGVPVAGVPVDRQRDREGAAVMKF